MNLKTPLLKCVLSLTLYSQVLVNYHTIVLIEMFYFKHVYAKGNEKIISIYFVADDIIYFIALRCSINYIYFSGRFD